MSNGTAPEKTGKIWQGSIWRPKWFISTRFMAVAGVAGALFVSKQVFGIDEINYSAIWVLCLVLLVTNILYLLYYLSGRLRTETGDIDEGRAAWFITIQINADLAILTMMIHYGGGATNPFILYYFFHPILASILLSKRAAYLEAGVAAGLFSGMTALEGYGILRHYSLYCPGCHSQTIFILGMIFAISSAIFIAVYMATSIMDRLRIHQRDLERSLEEQRRLEEEKSRFLDVVAHDLKSPLAAIETMVASALSVHGDTMQPDVKKILERIPNRTQDLLKFIRDLLEFSRISTIGEIKTAFEPLDFLPIVAATVEMHMGHAMEKNIDVRVQSDPDIPQIMGSRDHLERMVDNLVSNAIRYTDNHGSVTVKIAVEDTTIVLTVADTGIGIPEHALPHVFTEFFRADNAKKFTSAGTGLGMSITKSIVEEHGGTIRVESREGEGTTFTVRLPAITGHNNGSSAERG